MKISVVLPILLLIGVAHFLIDSMLGIWPVYKSMVQLDLAVAGLIVSAGALIGEGSQLLFGGYSDKGYRKMLIIIGLVLAMSNAFLPYISNYWGLFCLYLMTCIGSGSFHPCAASLVSGLIPERRNLLMTIFATGGSLGMATSQLTFGQAHAFLNGNTALLIVPALFLALFLILYPVPQQQEGGGHQFSFSHFRDFFRNPTLRSLYISQVANQSILWGTIFILPDALKALEYPDWVCFGGGHFCFIFGASCMLIPGGYLADLFSARKVLLFGGIISSIAFYSFLFWGGISFTLLFTTLFILGASLALMNPIAVSLGNKLEPARSGAVSAFLMGLVWCVSEAVGPGVLGLLSTLFEDYAAVKSLAVLGSLFLIQIYFTLRIPGAVIEREYIRQTID